MEQKRIEWCDVFKGIAIILIVVGHATEGFHQFIYQFHVAAFFFISGYTCKFEKKSFGNILLSRFYKLMVPYYVINLCGITLFYVLNLFGILPYISTIVYPDTYLHAVLALFQGNTIYCDWLGAMWFLPVLFKATLIAKAIHYFGKKKTVILLMSFMTYLFSHQWALMKLDDHQWSLAGVAQLFIICGWLLSSVKRESIQWKKTLIASVAVGLLWYISIHYITNKTMDWPSKRFNNPLVDLYLPVYGIVLCLFISLLLSRNKYACAIFSCIGKNSMAIMCFHFIGFKAAELMLIPVHLYSFEMLYSLTPKGPFDVWYILVPISIIFSLAIWKVIDRFRVSSVCAGSYSTGQLIDIIKSGKWDGSLLYDGYCHARGLMENTLCLYRNSFKNLKHKKMDALILGCLLALGGGGADINALWRNPYKLSG